MNEAPPLRAPAVGRGHLAILCSLLFCSGMASLIFQVVWLRGFGIVLGSTVTSMSCVITVFMLGLALGSLAMNRLLRFPALFRLPLATYGALELAGGLASLGVSWLLFREQQHLLPLTAGVSAPLAQRLVSQVLLCVAIIGLPTTLMGMTLPVISLVVRDSDQVPTLYGFNTIGAAVGSIVASFVLIYGWGCLVAAACAAGVDALVFLSAFALRNRFGASPSTDEPGPAVTAPPPAGPELSRPLMLAIAAFSGFVALSCEITWTRFLSLCFGNRVYVTSIALALILLFMGQAARMSARLARGPQPIGKTLLLACTLTLISFGVALQLERSALLGSNRGMVIAFLLTLVVFPTTTLGLLFPLTLAARRSEPGLDRGRWVAQAYGVNTVASLLGSLVSGYVLIEAFGSNGVIVLNCLLVAVALGALWVTFRPILTPSDHVGAAIALGCFAVLIVPKGGMAPPVVDPSTVVLNSEDENGVFNVVDAGPGRLRVINNRTDLVYLYGEPATQLVQESQAYFPVLYAPHLDRVLNIGAGYGITAGAFANIREVGHVDAVEIVPAMAHNAGLFRLGNRGYDHNPRVTLSIEDGRYFLATASQPFDIISVNTSDPYLPGATSVFSREFYDLARSKMTPGAIFSQHLFGPDSNSLLRGVMAVFPYVRAIPAYGNGLTVVASLTPLVEHQRSLFETSYDHGRSLFDPLGVPGGLDALDELMEDGDDRLRELVARGDWFENSDVNPVLEFRRIPGKLGLFYTRN